MNHRRKLVVALCASALAASFGSFAQQPSNVPRIGLLWIHADGSAHYVDAFREAMRAQGYVDGKNVIIDESFLVDDYSGLPAAAARLARAKVSLVVTWGSTALQAAHKAAPQIPIVMASGSDPVKLGIVASLSRPGGNITGLLAFTSDLSGKRLELLREIAPRIQRVAVLYFPGSPGEAISLRNLEAASLALRLETRPTEVRTSGDIESAIAGIAKMDAQAVAVVGSSLLTANRKRVAAAIEKLRLPAIYDRGEYAESGGLITYGVGFAEQFRRAVIHVDKVLKGTKPGDIPIEQPTTFELVVNLRTAKALGVKIPNSILVQATKVIE